MGASAGADLDDLERELAAWTRRVREHQADLEARRALRALQRRRAHLVGRARAGARAALARLGGERRQPLRVLEAAEEGLRLDPDDATLHLVVGGAARRLRLPGVARDAFEEAALLDPACGGAWLELARCLEREGEDEAAAQAWRRVQLLDPSCAEAGRRLQALAGPRARPAGWEAALGEAPAFVACLRRLDALARDGDRPVLLAGEPGSGKRLLAELLHRRGRPDRPLVVVDATTAPRASLRARLVGALAEASGGTLLVLRAEELPVAAQDALAEAVVCGVVGAGEAGGGRLVDARVVLTTRVDPRGLVDRLRLACAPVAVPPLRDRPGDARAIAAAVVARTLEAAGRPAAALRLTARAEALLEAHRWPGNVRQTARAMAHLVTLRLQRDAERVAEARDRSREARGLLDASAVREAALSVEPPVVPAPPPRDDDDLLRAAAGREAALAAPARLLGGRTLIPAAAWSAGRFVVEALKTVVCVGHPLLGAHLTGWLLVGEHPGTVPLPAKVFVVCFLLAMTTASIVGFGWQTLGPRRFALGAAAGVLLHAVVAFGRA